MPVSQTPTYKTPVVKVAVGPFTPPAQESIGPKTNSRKVAMLPPDQYQSNPTTGRQQSAARPAATALLPDANLNNMVFNNPNSDWPTQIGNAVVNSKTIGGVNGQYVQNEYGMNVTPPAVTPGNAPVTIPDERQLLSVIASNIGV